MITPSRWFAGVMGLNEFREEMLNDKRIKEIHDFSNSSECFPGVSIEGGVNFFLWDKRNADKCTVFTYEKNKCISKMKRDLLEKGSDVFIRYNESVSIYRKIMNFEEDSFSELVSVISPFGLPTSFKKYKKLKFDNSIKLYGTKFVGYVDKSELKNGCEYLDKYKIYITSAYGNGNSYPYQVLNKPFIGERDSCSTQTYVVIAPNENIEYCENVMSYIKTRFFRFLVSLKKNTQHCSRIVYQFVPMQDFSKPWTDKELYEKYGLDEKEIAFIEKMIRPMELEDE
ncbi:Eco57I restriction-modification methylase domain-containing protein [Rodentibacter genomosp. 2]|uniref:Eco57I restriction-modification methylase domain-containing protein n=1 Tax=Rodentibacter genomosp. 2 TaxID=1908266 RepID=UPI0021186460|nr:Eco57I restriction-modification methylase domain-containing protein [Rodentibacter genomosp. 2]